MDKEKILDFLQDNGLTEIEEIKEGKEYFLVRFYYDFDEDELKAARAYAQDESDEEEESDPWFLEYFLPYLSEVAVDNVGDIIEECMEEQDVAIQYVSYDLGIDEYSYNEFIALVHSTDLEIDIDDFLEEV